MCGLVSGLAWPGDALSWAWAGGSGGARGCGGPRCAGTERPNKREREGGRWAVGGVGRWGEPGPAPAPAPALFLYRFLSCIYMTLKSSEREIKKELSCSACFRMLTFCVVMFGETIF